MSCTQGVGSCLKIVKSWRSNNRLRSVTSLKSLKDPGTTSVFPLLAEFELVFVLWQVEKYLYKASNKDTRLIFSGVGSSVFVVNFEQVLDSLILQILLLAFKVLKCKHITSLLKIFFPEF